MNRNETKPLEQVTFPLTYKQLETAHNIYREQCFSCDFIHRSLERLEEKTGLCNLPYYTLRDETELLHEAYLQFTKLEDCNVAYNDTLDQVIDKIENKLVTGALKSHSVDKKRIVVVIINGIVSTAFTSLSDVQLEIIELDDEYATSDDQNEVFERLKNDSCLKNCEYALEVPGYLETLGLEVDA